MSKDICARYYRPPENILRSSEYDCKTDIWSYGCIIGELLRYHYDLTDNHSPILF